MIAKLLTVVTLAGLAALPARAEYTRNVAIVVWDGAEILDWGGPSEVFESASRFGRHGSDPAFRLYTVSKTTDPIVSQRFITVVPQYSIEDAPPPDIVVLPGGGTGSVLNDPEFLKWAGRVAQHSEVALSVCTGAFILAHHGMLDGKTVTTWYGATDALERQYPQATVHRGRRFVDNGQVVTTAGVSAGIDGSLHVVARLLGRAVADRTAEYMEYKWSPEAYLAQNYDVLNPSLDARGRRAQQAGIDARARNWTAAAAGYRALVEDDPDDLESWFQLGTVLHGQEEFTAAAEAFSRSAALGSRRMQSHYNAACAHARADRGDRALEALAAAIDAGFRSPDHARQDPDLATIREDERFDRLMARIR